MATGSLRIWLPRLAMLGLLVIGWRVLPASAPTWSRALLGVAIGTAALVVLLTGVVQQLGRRELDGAEHRVVWTRRAHRAAALGAGCVLVGLVGTVSGTSWGAPFIWCAPFPLSAAWAMYLWANPDTELRMPQGFTLSQPHENGRHDTAGRPVPPRRYRR